MRVVPAALVAAALVACGDADPLGPELPAALPASPIAAPPLEDALERVVPALKSTDATADLHAALSAMLVDAGAGPRRAAETALREILAEQPDAASEVDVILLALSAQP